MKYIAFISYAHANSGSAARLHRQLEHYKPPKNSDGTTFDRLSPIFVDTAELSAAASLSERIQSALKRSRFLIVLCSPAAKASHWVNEEIRLFRKLHGDESILCALLDGTPETSFPEALTEGGREPLAADLSRKNFRHGVNQLAASLLDTDLDRLVQRDVQRLRRRVTAITVSAAAIVLSMGLLTWTALQARQLADQRRLDAEGMVEFMLTDLKDKLDAVGRLDALQAVGDQAADYYERYPLHTHNDDALARRANVFTYLGEIQDKLGNGPESERYFRQAFEATDRLLGRAPTDSQRIFDHAQSAFWRGYYHHNLEQYDKAHRYYESYLTLAKRLVTLDKDERADEELSYALTNMGAIEEARGHLDIARQYFMDALAVKRDLLRQDDTQDRTLTVANALAHLANISGRQGELSEATKLWQEADHLIDEKLTNDPENASLIHQKLIQTRSLARLTRMEGRLEDSDKYLLTGRGLATATLARDPSQVTFRYEKLSLDGLELERRLLEADPVAARDLYQDIQADMAEFPPTFQQDFRYKVLENSFASLTLYDALVFGDAETAAEETARAQALMREQGLSTAQDIVAQPYAFSLALMLHIAAPTQASHDLVGELCALTATDLNAYISALLSALPECGSQHAPTKTPTLIHALRTAHETATD